MRKYTIIFILVFLTSFCASCTNNIVSDNFIEINNSDSVIVSPTNKPDTTVQTVSPTNKPDTTVQTVSPIINFDNTRQTYDKKNELQKTKLNTNDLNISYNNVLINDTIKFTEITKKLGTGQDIYQLISQSTTNPSIKRWKLGYPNKSLPEIVLTYLDGAKETYLVSIRIFGKEISTSRGIKVGRFV